jgi:hypothetical protein
MTLDQRLKENTVATCFQMNGKGGDSKLGLDDQANRGT